MNFKVSKKVDDKWKTFGSVKKNQWGNLSLGMRCTPEFKQMVNAIDDGGFINFAMFEDKEQTR